MSDVDILYQIAKLKDTDYKNVLAINALIKLLIEKKIITNDELLMKIRDLDVVAITSINANSK